MKLLPIAATVAFFAAAACAVAAPAGVPSTATLRLYAMDCGTLTVPDADPFADDGAYKGVSRTLVVPC